MTNKDTEVKEKKEEIKISKIAEFELGIITNVQNLSWALTSCGYYVKVYCHGNSGYTLKVYSDRI